MKSMMRTGTNVTPIIVMTPAPTRIPTPFTTYHSGYRCSSTINAVLMRNVLTPVMVIEPSPSTAQNSAAYGITA